MWRIDHISERLIQLVLVACALALALYLLLCDQIGRLTDLRDQTGVTLTGRAVDCRATDGPGGRGVYRLEDPTGTTYVVTSRGVPAENAVLVIRGIKRTMDKNIVVVETHRIVGSF